MTDKKSLIEYWEKEMAKEKSKPNFNSPVIKKELNTKFELTNIRPKLK